MKNKTKMLLAFAVTGACLLPVMAGDYPLFRGDEQRSGNPRAAGLTLEDVGAGKVTWYFPKNRDVGFEMQRDDLGNPDPESVENYISLPSYSAGWTRLADAAASGVSRVGDSYLASEAVLGNAPSASAETVTWTLHANKPRRYRLEVFIPSTGTILTGSGQVRTHTAVAIYKIEYGSGQSVTVPVDQSLSNRWARLGDTFSFPTEANGNDNIIRVTLYNYTTDADDTDPPKIVLADAIRAVPEMGTSYSSPAVQDVDGLGRKTVFFTRNEPIADPNDADGLTTLESGVVYALNDDGTERWRFPLSLLQNNSTVVDNKQGGDDSFTADYAPNGDWLVSSAADVDQANVYGADYAYAPETPDRDLESFAQWKLKAPNNQSLGRVNVFAWIPRDKLNEFATAAEYTVRYSELLNGNLVQRSKVVTINQNNPSFADNLNENSGRWVQLGSASYLHSDRYGLTVELTNYGIDQPVNGIPRRVVADALAFVGRASSPIYSSPAVAQVNGRWTLFVGSEDGHVYSIDAKGGSGGTFAYWAYPSLGSPGSDPNRRSAYSGGIDGRDYNNTFPITGFGYSSPVVAAGKVFIANSNGRLYALNAVGRNDHNATTRTAGTTYREWAYPNILLQDSAGTTLVFDEQPIPGGIAASPAVDSSRVYITGMDGRCYAVKIEDDSGTNTKAVLDWAYPRIASIGDPGEASLGVISSTPAVSSGHVYITVTNPDTTGEVHAINKADGTRSWMYPNANTPAADVPPAFEYSSPLLLPIQLAAGGPTTDAVVVCALDRMYALDAAGTAGNGSLIFKTEQYSGKIHSSPVAVDLIPAYNGGPATGQKAVVFGTRGGHLYGVYANAYQTNPTTNPASRAMWQLDSLERNVGVFSSFAAAGNFMYTATESGRLVAISNTGLANGFDEGAPPISPEPRPDPGNTDYVEPDFTTGEVTLIDYESWKKLQVNTGSDAIQPSSATLDARTAFEWGDRLYILVKNFRFMPTTDSHPTDPDKRGVQPTFSVQFWNKDSNITYSNALVKTIPNATPDSDARKEGYAILQVDINFVPSPGTRDWLTPGLRFNITVMGRGRGSTSWSKQLADSYMMGNPIAITNGPVAYGNTTNASDPTVAQNGNPPLPLDLGSVQHGSVGNNVFGVADRSVQGVNTNINRPIDNIRATSSNLAFIGGSDAAYKPLWGSLALPFEQPPGLNRASTLVSNGALNSNNSLDYPDIDLRNHALYHTSTTFGRVDMSIGPVSSPGRSVTGIVLTRPTFNVGSINLNDPQTWSARTIRFDDVQSVVQVPRFQPPSRTGYEGIVYVYQDLFQDRDFTGGPSSLLQTPPPKNTEPYRQINPRTFVPADERLKIDEDLVDLGPMPHGALLDSASTTANSLWPNSTNNLAIPPQFLGAGARTYDSFFKPFTVRNLGNVNLLNVRVLKSFQFPNGAQTVRLFSDTVSERDWISGNPMIVSSLDRRFDSFQRMGGIGVRTPGIGTPTLHKARPGDRVETVLTVPDRPYNTMPFANSLPYLSLAVPIGQPVGTYAQTVTVVENTNANGLPTNDDGVIHVTLASSQYRYLEPYSDPSMKLKVKVREARMTNGYTRGGVMHLDTPQADPQRAPTNVMPAAWRTSTGNLGLVFASNRDAQMRPTDQWGLFTAWLGNSAVRPSTGVPLADLYSFRPTTSGQWWKPVVGDYPTNTAAPATIFTEVLGSYVPNSAMYGAPSLAIPSGLDPGNNYNMALYDTPFVYFIGEAYKRDTNGASRVENTIIYTRADANGQFAPPQRLNIENRAGEGGSDPSMAKYRPVPIYVNRNGTTMLFWYGATTGGYRLYYVSGDPTANEWSGVQTLITPNSITSAINPYPVVKQSPNGRRVVEVFYEGISRDRQVSEIFMNRYEVRGGGRPNLGNPMRFARVTHELTGQDGIQPVWRARHLSWVMSGGVGNAPAVWIRAKGGAETLIAGGAYSTWVSDDTTGLYSAKSKLGGLVVADPSAGTVRFGTAAPFASDKVLLDYIPQTMRMSGTAPGKGGASRPTAYFDKRYASDRALIFNASNVLQDALNILFPISRQWLFYAKTGSTASERTTLYYRTLRYGVKLSYPVFTTATTDPALFPSRPFNTPGLSVSGARVPFQVDPGVNGVDPVAGRIYFADGQEDPFSPSNNAITVTYQRAGDGRSITETLRAEWIEESAEQAVPIEQFVSESNLWVAPDLTTMSVQGGPVANQADHLWLFWNSSRVGTDDLYYMTIAPRFTNFPKTQ